VEKTCHDTATRVPTVFRMARKTSPYRSALLRVGPTLTAFYLRLDVAARHCLGSRIGETSPFDSASPVSNWRLTPPWSFQSPSPHQSGALVAFLRRRCAAQSIVHRLQRFASPRSKIISHAFPACWHFTPGAGKPLREGMGTELASNRRAPRRFNSPRIGGRPSRYPEGSAPRWRASPRRRRAVHRNCTRAGNSVRVRSNQLLG
jgi:hypothetical protein